MKTLIVGSWAALMDSRHNPLSHLNLASQHYFMQVLGWMWSMVFSLAYLSIFQFGYVWLGHVLFIGGWAFTVAIFRTVREEATVPAPALTRGSRCVWKIDSEA